MDVLREHFLKEGHLNKDDLLEIVLNAHEIFRKEPNLLRL